MDDCLGCRTAAGAFGPDEIYRDELVVAVVAQHAVNPGHVVVVSREHVRNALTMSDDLLFHLTRVGRDLGRELLAALPCPSVMLLFNNEAPCQSLFHAHLHVVPREHGDCMDRRFGGEVPEVERRAMAARLRARLARDE